MVIHQHQKIANYLKKAVSSDFEKDHNVLGKMATINLIICHLFARINKSFLQIMK